GLQVTLVAREGMALIVLKVAYPFAHGIPTRRGAAVPMPTFPKDFEFSGLIDDGLHTQDQTQFIVHLQPVVPQVMLDASAGVTHRFVMGLYFSVEFLVPFASEIVEHLLRAEGQ